MPRYKDGTFQYNKFDNAFINRLNSLVYIKKLPNNYKDYFVELSPVDFCSKAILLLLENNDNQTIYHINNPNKIELTKLLEILSNDNIELIEPKEFNANITNYPINYTKNLFEMITKPNILENKISNNITIQKLSNLNFYWPNYTNKYIKHIKKLLYKE